MKDTTNVENSYSEPVDNKTTELEERVDILSKRYDKAKLVIDDAFSHPIRFACHRIYHRFIKRDENRE